MKFFGWLTGAVNPNSDLCAKTPEQASSVPEQKSVFQSILDEIHEEYKDELQKSTQRITELQAIVSTLEEKISFQAEEIEHLRSSVAHSRKVSKLKADTCSAREGVAAFSQALSVMKDAAEKGNLQAQFYLGISYTFGVGKNRNSLLGEQWLAKSASLKNSSIYFLLGLLKYRGVLLDKGLQQALNWMKLAYQLNQREAELFIGEIKAEIRSDEQQAAALRKVGQNPSAQNVVHPDEKVVFTRPIFEPGKPSFLQAVKSGNAAPAQKFDWSLDFPEDQYEGVDRKAYRLGYRRGVECLKKAIRFNKIMSHSDGYILKDLRSTAKRFAMRHGYLQHIITEGMEELGTKLPITSDMREAFIKGVKAGMVDDRLSDGV